MKEPLTQTVWKLDEYIEKTAVCGTFDMQIPYDSHTKREERTASLTVKYCNVDILKPKPLSSKKFPKSFNLNVITVEEQNVPDDCEPISWDLITNLSVDDFETAMKCVKYYTFRWLVERFHFVLKSGLKFEEAQLKTVDRLMRLEAIHSIIADEILYLTYLARTDPTQSCEIAFSDDEWND